VFFHSLYVLVTIIFRFKKDKKEWGRQTLQLQAEIIKERQEVEHALKRLR
jgi:hypothetical protein